MHKQASLGDAKSDFDVKDWVSSENIIRTNKNLIVKDFFETNDIETIIRKGQKGGVTKNTGNYTTLMTDYYIGCVHTTAITVTLPPIARAGKGKTYMIKDETGLAATNIITIDADGSETIDGAATLSLNVNYGAVILVCSNGAWYTVPPPPSTPSTFYANGNSGATKTIDWSNGLFQTLTLTANCVLTFTNGVAGRTYVLELLQDSTGSRTVTWPTSVAWPSSSNPVLTTAARLTDEFTFYMDGTYYAGVTSLAYNLTPNVLFDASSNGRKTADSSTPLTFSHTVANKNNRVLYVCAWNSDGTNSSFFISGITYAGVAMTRLTHQALQSTHGFIDIWYLIAPATGANNVVITPSTTSSLFAAGMSFYNANQTTQDDSGGSTTSGGVGVSSVTTSPVATAPGGIVIGIGAEGSNGTVGTITGGTVVYLENLFGSRVFWVGYLNAPVSAAGAQDFTPVLDANSDIYFYSMAAIVKPR